MNKNEYIKYLEEKLNIKDNIKINKDFTFIGVTGSRGKSTACFMIHEFLKEKGYKSILYSSIGIDSPKSLISKDEAVENPIYNEEMIYNALKESIEYETDYLIIEVNERAISKGYTKNTPFDIRVLTNIIPKQNDLFYPNYVSLKQSFITEASINTKFIIELIDKDSISVFRTLDRSKVTTITSEYLASRRGVEKEEIDYLMKTSNEIYDSINGLSFMIENKKDSIDINTNLIMPYNGLNITLSYAILKNLIDFKNEEFLSFIKDINIPGRDELINYKNRKIIISLNLMPQLENLKRYQERKEINKIIVVTGSTGLGYKSWQEEFPKELYLKDRKESIKFSYDYVKKNSDFLFITKTDIGASNKEELFNYQEEIVKGYVEYSIIEDRKDAIKSAIKSSNEGDVIFISGRGNRRIMCDSYDHITLFKDKEEVEKIIEEMEKEI